MFAIPEGIGDDRSTHEAEFEALEMLLSDEGEELYGCTRSLALWVTERFSSML